MERQHSSTIISLNETFKNKEKKREICKSTEKYFQPGTNASRIFDKFPCLIPETTLQKLTHKFEEILNNREEKSYLDNEGIYILSNNCKNQIKELHEKMIEIAKIELLNKQGKIKQDIIKTLGWEKYSKELESKQLTSMIIYGYVSLIDQNITKKCDKTINRNQEKSGAIFMFLNRNLKIWIAKHFNSSAIDLSNEYFNRLLEESSNLTKKPTTIFLLTTCISGAAFYFYNEINKKEDETNNSWVKSIKNVIGI